MSRSALQQLKAATEEAARWENIKKVVVLLYKKVVNMAKTSVQTSYKFEVRRTDLRAARSAMGARGVLTEEDMNVILDNQADVIKGLRELFPDSDISIKTLSKAADGQFYDVSTMDESLLRFIDRRHDQTFLVVDWS